MNIKARLLLLVKGRRKNTVVIPELQEFYGYLLDELDAFTDNELEEYYNNSTSTIDFLRLVAWQSVPINIEFSERFVDEVINLSSV
ncbi:hypothetical protein VCHA50O413_20370 [Vibrio chagasii]|nr:hypothetical protein VCHA34P114_220010 [Vibrio chagasii]CAH7006032.1 hypothetical protein VCHA50O405_10366 [Vibrio chagasii]CAH7094319.1 hypothetical protein VCHA50O402_20370 [Vibrio chagasii]CAH7145703.1 hypothetical protein VCHA50O413_20370 [Vibrio chagasii]CAH7153293.1 hypothetical protein VCHA50O387_210008 [Vibrio chagasii]